MKDPREIGRDVAAKLGAEAVAICERGWYVAPSGTRVQIGEAVARARAGTRSVVFDAEVATPGRGPRATRVSVTNESTLAAARRLHAAGLEPAALNFASARHPGGGFLRGARAQEESLCRASALYTCLVGQPMYAYHEQLRDALYTSWVIHSPAVPVFRADEGPLLESPWPCGFLTAAAPNAKALRERAPGRLGEVGPAFSERISRVLAVAAAAEHRSVVLGAWGCGAFGGDAEDVARRFAEALAGPFFGVFEEVVFAVLDTSPEQRFIGPFARRLGR